MAETDKVTVERLYKDVKATSHIRDINTLLEWYAELPTPYDPYVMPLSSPQDRAVENTRRSRTLTRTPHVSNRSSSRARAHQIVLYLL